jgi:hypothetical protein
MEGSTHHHVRVLAQHFPGGEAGKGGQYRAVNHYLLPTDLPFLSDCYLRSSVVKVHYTRKYLSDMVTTELCGHGMVTIQH